VAIRKYILRVARGLKAACRQSRCRHRVQVPLAGHAFEVTTRHQLMLTFESPDTPGGVSSVMAIRNHDCMGDAETSLRAENAELRRLLEKHQWAGLVPVKSSGCCPECCGSSPPHGSGHRPGCAIAVILAITAPFDE